MSYMKFFWGVLATLFLGCLIGLQSCQPDVEVTTETGFKVLVDEYRRDVPINSNSKVRIHINEKISLRDNFYMVKYFSSSGTGHCYFNKELNEFKSNEWVIPSIGVDPFTKDKYFDIYYAPYSYGDHAFSLTIRDSFGNEEKVAFSLSVKKSGN